MRLALWSVQLQQHLAFASTPVQLSSSESSNQMSRGQVSREKMGGILQNCRNKRNQRKLPGVQTSARSEEEEFQQNYLEWMERQDKLFLENMQSLQENVRTLK